MPPNVIVADSPFFFVVSAMVVVLFLIVLIILLVCGRLAAMWMRATSAGAPIPLWALIGMKLRRVPIDLVIDAYIRLRQAGLDVPLEALDAHVLAGGSISRVTDWLVAARVADLTPTWEQLAKADLAKRLADVDQVAGRDPERLAAALRAAEEDPRAHSREHDRP